MSISTEYRKGDLFIRLMGRCDVFGYLNIIENFIEEFDFRFIVLNINNLYDVSLESIDHIIKYNKKILKKKKKLFICDCNIGRNRMFRNNIPNISDELEAFSLI